MNKPLVSLCIPTNGVIEWVFPVLDSIYKQRCLDELFEVVITDNGDNQEFEKQILLYKQNHPNLHYYQTDALPFINEIESYKHARGHLIKFVNHRTILVNGALNQLIHLVKDNFETKPVMYFANGVLEKKN